MGFGHITEDLETINLYLLQRSLVIYHREYCSSLNALKHKTWSILLGFA